MSAIAFPTRLAITEIKLYLREPLAAFFAVVLPLALLLILGATIPDFREPADDLGGVRPVDTHLPGMMILLSVLTVAFSILPATLVVYRERGVLRRMSTTPVKPISVLSVQLVINAAASIVATALMLVSGHLVLEIPYPPMFLAFVGVFLLGSVTMFGIGLALAAAAPNSRVVQSAGAGIMFPLLFLGGMWLPRALMPDWLRVVSDYSPAGAFGQALTDVLSNQAPSLLHLGVMTAWAAAGILAATRWFRWE
ncbi:transport permease protein [Acrocarpospora phusangensis]|uniref:Transport permease protein n=1 Tax=Acrocarpospora phusangensis TaxID=1070424 RepID=A0A919QJI1_9ACTN|nr:ABC transporter permease [Acrocarpospora phusangensis]GIH29244.1 transport permease protein [Acrocarpospora phusangensis]